MWPHLQLHVVARLALLSASTKARITQQYVNIYKKVIHAQGHIDETVCPHVHYVPIRLMLLSV